MLGGLSDRVSIGRLLSKTGALLRMGAIQWLVICGARS